MLRIENAVVENGTFWLSADIQVDSGQKVAVIGPSGAGKSTLIGAIAGFYPLKDGHIYWNDTDISQTEPGSRPVAMLFQDGNMFPHLTVAQNVGLGIRPDLKLDASQTEFVHIAIARVGLKGMADRKPAALSGGQQSRAALARVLVQDRPLLLLDEPFAALGPALRVEMLNLVDDLVRETGATLLMVSHAPEDARRIADQVILVEGGVAHPPQDTKTLLDNPPPALRAYLG
ncbi:MAG: thiamine transport system ATP-binding protein [Paracoccaceae bacterium]|jgi:thiamine transport system ATP-binding protein